MDVESSRERQVKFYLTQCVLIGLEQPFQRKFRFFFEDEILDVTSACLWEYGPVMDLRLFSMSLTHVKSQTGRMRSRMGELERYDRGKVAASSKFYY